MSKKFTLIVLKCMLAFLAVGTCGLLHAQYDNGSLVGTIRDTTGAPIPNAALTITNTATSIATQAKTDATGDYEVPTLRVGVYSIVASAPGFANAVADKISIQVGGRERIDLKLSVGAATTSVEVSDVALQLETETSERGQVISNYQSEALPLVSRNYSDLLGLVTGVRQAPTAATTSSISSLVRAGAYNVNGQRSMFNNFLLDGMDNNAYGESNQGFDNQIIAVPPDSVAQFQVVTNNESAEYGRASGATVNVASQGGTNKFHGTVYEFIRNTDLNAAGFFKPTIGSHPFQKPVFNRNQFGFDVGGPIVKDKLFFFLDYEGFRQTLKPLSVLTLPTQNELNGILVVSVRDPLTGAVYPAGTPITAINPISAQIISFFKQIPGLPVSGSATTGVSSNDYAVQAPFTDNADKGDLRLDYQQSPSSSWFLRVSDGLWLPGDRRSRRGGGGGLRRQRPLLRRGCPAVTDCGGRTIARGARLGRGVAGSRVAAGQHAELGGVRSKARPRRGERVVKAFWTSLCLLAGLGAVNASMALAGTPAGLCGGAIEMAQDRHAVPAGLLFAIGEVESGRPDPVTHRLVPWPWTVQAQNQSYYFATEAEAVAWVQAAQARGILSIDVGCMQINLMYHPAAFQNLDAAFDPASNADYAARFLVSLHAGTGDWQKAAGLYHSQTLALAIPYAQKVEEALTGKMLPPMAVEPPKPTMLTLLQEAWGATLDSPVAAPQAVPVVTLSSNSPVSRPHGRFRRARFRQAPVLLSYEH